LQQQEAIEMAEREPTMPLYVVLWVVMIVIVAFEVFLTFRAGLPARTLDHALLLLAIIEALIGVAFFMHLKYEASKLIWTLAIGVIFVLFMLDHIWPDAYRMARLSMFR
jgi:heme/copper-type cytochrome/quinol oxidase subunit 4